MHEQMQVQLIKYSNRNEHTLHASQNGLLWSSRIQSLFHHQRRLSHALKCLAKYYKISHDI